MRLGRWPNSDPIAPAGWPRAAACKRRGAFPSPARREGKLPQSLPDVFAEIGQIEDFPGGDQLGGLAEVEQQLRVAWLFAELVKDVEELVVQNGAGWIKPGDHEYETLKDDYLALYEANLNHHTRLFPGMDEVLNHLDQRGTAWGIVTNKHSRFTLPLLRGLDLDRRAHCIVSGDSVPVAKPDPAGLRLAAKKLRLAPSKNIFYIGDDERDVQASLAAGMTPVVARYGYLGNGKPVEQWGATLFIDDALALLPLFGHA